MFKKSEESILFIILLTVSKNYDQHEAETLKGNSRKHGATLMKLRM